MRFLHTSDWHLGRSFHGASLQYEQEAVIDRIVELAAAAEVDLVVIAGDLYDRAIPPADAVTLFDEALVRLSETGAKIVAVAGNHDSPSRVAVADRVLERTGVAVRGDISRCTQSLQFDPEDGGPPVNVYPVPYLEPSLAAAKLAQIDEAPEAEAEGSCEVGRHDPVMASSDGQQTIEIKASRRVGHRRSDHHDVTELATTLIRRAMASTEPARTVVVAHTFVDGATPTESERDLSIGNIDRVGLSVFDGFDYVALGHLHRCQAFDNNRVAYSGSPLPYSFSEENDTKAVRIVEMNARGQCSTEVIPLTVGRPLRTLRGRIADLLSNAEFAEAEQARVRFLLTDPELPLQAMARLQVRFQHAVTLEHEPDGQIRDGSEDVVDAVENSEEPLDLALRFWADQQGADASDAHKEALTSALEAAVGKYEA